MTLKKTILILTAGGLAIAAVFGVFGYRAVSARAAAPEVASLAVSAHRGGGFGGRIILEDLAEALGITTDELSAAQQEAKGAALDQAVEEGLITAAQAEELRSTGAAFPFGGNWGGWLSQQGIDYQALLADALGISTDDLQAAYGKAVSARIDQAVANGNLSEEQADLMKGQYALRSSSAFQTAMQAAFETAVKAAVESGVITQAQADLILERAQNGPAGFPGMDGFPGRGFDRPGRGMDGAPFQPDGGFQPHGGGF
ncbi:MAG: hypothetical protein L0Z70_07965 [Chloroflexi bacterium]|nr:hypothetical protein [Chloroflexota bacterium]